MTEEQTETPQRPEETTAKQDQETPPVALFPSVTDEERNKVIEAYRQGIQRRGICSYLHWGSAKYATIVKPVLNAYEQQGQQTENSEKQIERFRFGVSRSVEPVSFTYAEKG